MILFHPGAKVERYLHAFRHSILGQLAAILLHLRLLDPLHDAVGVDASVLVVAVHLLMVKLPERVLDLMSQVLVARQTAFAG